jgi:uncharacterized protein YecT (DUF1311 family)
MKNYLSLVLFIFMAGTTIYAAPQKKDPIDIAMDKAMEKNPSTAGMVQAAAQADEKWQKEIERTLGVLQKEMTAEQWKALQESQQAWVQYRDKELQTQNALYGSMEGTLWRPVAASSAMQLNRARALLLRDYIRMRSER